MFIVINWFIDWLFKKHVTKPWGWKLKKDPLSCVGTIILKNSLLEWVETVEIFQESQGHDCGRICKRAVWLIKMLLWIPLLLWFRIRYSPDCLSHNRSRFVTCNWFQISKHVREYQLNTMCSNHLFLPDVGIYICTHLTRRLICMQLSYRKTEYPQCISKIRIWVQNAGIFCNSSNAACEQSPRNSTLVIGQYCCPKAATFSSNPCYDWPFAQASRVIPFSTSL